MINQPLSSSDHSKILIFTLLIIPPTLFFVGILPSIFLTFGIFMMKKNSDFSHIDAAIRNTKYYLYAIIAMAACFAAWAATTLGAVASWERNTDEFMASLAVIAAAFAYIAILNKLFHQPLMEHKDWVAKNGIFSTKPANGTIQTEINIVKRGGITSFSVADELIKWAKLKEDGHISEQEYNDARKKLLEEN